MQLTLADGSIFRSLAAPQFRRGPDRAGTFYRLAATSGLDLARLVSAINGLLAADNRDPLPDGITTLAALADAVLAIVDADADEALDPADPETMSKGATFCPRCLDRRDERVEMRPYRKPDGKTVAACPVCKSEIEATDASRRLAVRSEPFRSRRLSRKPSRRRSDAEVERDLRARGIAPAWKREHNRR